MCMQDTASIFCLSVEESFGLSVVPDLLCMKSQSSSLSFHSQTYLLHLAVLLGYSWIIFWTQKQQQQKTDLCHFWNLLVARVMLAAVGLPLLTILTSINHVEPLRDFTFLPPAFQTFAGSQLESRCECQTFWRLIKLEWLNAVPLQSISTCATAAFVTLAPLSKLCFFCVIGELNCA